jgi:hypothetical protein
VKVEQSCKGKGEQKGKKQGKWPDNAENTESMTRMEDPGTEDELEAMYELRLEEEAEDEDDE